MADKKDETEEKDDELTVVVDDPKDLGARDEDLDADKSKKKAAADDDEDRDDDEDGPREDARVGASDEEEEETDKRELRRKERKRRADRRRTHERERWDLIRENNFLKTRNEQLERSTVELARRVDTIETTTVDGRIGQYKAAIAKADAAIAEGVNAKRGEDVAEATAIRDDLRDQLKTLEAEKKAQSERKAHKEDDGEKMDPKVARQARDWLGRNTWFDPNRSDEDSAIAGAIDDTLIREGRLNPGTAEYWDEFDRRIAKRLPHVKPGKKRMNGHDRDDDADDDDRDQERGERGANGEGGGERKSTKGERRAPNGGPKFRKSGAGRELGTHEVYLSRERLEAMAEAGIELDSPQGKRLMKRYRDFDRDNSAR